MNLLAEFGLPVLRTAMPTFSIQKIRGIELFDRQLHAAASRSSVFRRSTFASTMRVAAPESDGSPGIVDLTVVLVGFNQAS